MLRDQFTDVITVYFTLNISVRQAVTYNCLIIYVVISLKILKRLWHFPKKNHTNLRKIQSWKFYRAPLRLSCSIHGMMGGEYPTRNVQGMSGSSPPGGVDWACAELSLPFSPPPGGYTGHLCVKRPIGQPLHPQTARAACEDETSGRLSRGNSSLPGEVVNPHCSDSATVW